MHLRSAILTVTALLLAGCAAPGTGASDPGPGTPATSSPAAIKSAPGTQVESIGLLKNYFYNNYSDHCADWSLKGTTSEYVTYGECAGTPTYFWLFSNTKQRDALMGKIREKKMPLLVSDKWVIASNFDLKPAQDDIGGAINP